VGRNRGHPWGAFHGHRHLGLEELSISPPKVSSARDDGAPKSITGSIFAFDGATVALRLRTVHQWQARPPDDVFRLPARLADGELTYQAPNGAWVDLARFEDGRFVAVGSGRKRIYEPIAAGDLDPPDRTLIPPQGPG
jgi:hypothetical protein